MDSGINLELPQTPQTQDKELYRELSLIYNALRLLQQNQIYVPPTKDPEVDGALWNADGALAISAGPLGV